ASLVGASVVWATFAPGRAQIFPPSPPAVVAATGGDVYRGETVFQSKCASCHGQGGRGGGVGPRLVDSGVDAAMVTARVQQGRGVMSAGLVDGHERADVVAYVVSISGAGG